MQKGKRTKPKSDFTKKNFVLALRKVYQRADKPKSAPKLP